MTASDEFRHQDTEVFGYFKKIFLVKVIQMVDLSYSGVSISTYAVRTCEHNRAREIIRWKGVLGKAENCTLTTLKE